MAEVRGQVFYKDGTVPVGGVSVIRFEPADDSTAEVRQGASGPINSDGSFEMSTKVFGDGVHYGDYVVTFAVLKSPTDPTPFIQPKYMTRSASPYKVKIDGDVTDLKYEIEPLPGVKGAAPAPPATPAG